MSSDTRLICLVILNLLMLNSGRLKFISIVILFLIFYLAYRIHSFHDPRQILILPYEDIIINDKEIFDIINSKPTLDNYDCLISCDLQTSLIINQPVRRDTKFLRFGRKR